MDLQIKMLYLGATRNIVRKSEEILTIEKETTIRQLIETLSQRYGDNFKYTILAANGSLRPDIILIHNGRSILNDDELDAPIKEESEMQLLAAVPVFAGG